MKSFDISDRSNEALYSDKIYKVIEVETPYDCGLKRKKSYANGVEPQILPVFKPQIISAFF